MNKVILIGRLTKDPEVRVTNNSKKVASFSMAISEGKGTDGQEITQFFNCSAWEKLAEIIEMYVKKGTRVAVVGKLQNKSWTKPDGSKGYSTDITVRELEILSSRSESQALSQQADSQSNIGNGGLQAAPSQPAMKEPELPEINVDDIDIQMPF
jgi:single-strand DNA-binding protein